MVWGYLIKYYILKVYNVIKIHLNLSYIEYILYNILAKKQFLARS